MTLQIDSEVLKDVLTVYVFIWFNTRFNFFAHKSRNVNVGAETIQHFLMQSKAPANPFIHTIKRNFSEFLRRDSRLKLKNRKKMFLLINYLGQKWCEF